MMRLKSVAATDTQKVLTLCVRIFKKRQRERKERKKQVASFPFKAKRVADGLVPYSPSPSGKTFVRLSLVANCKRSV